MAGLGMAFEVVDEKLAAGRGADFSAAKIREKQEHRLFGLDDDYYLPISHRADDPLDTAGMEVATLDTALGANNKGYQMLQRMGWGGRGLGRNEDGIAEPIKGGVEAGLRLGVGKAEEDSYYTAAENIVRKRLEVEVQAEEDEDRTRRREMAVEREQRIREDTSTARRNLYCETCHKQYKTAAELDTHLSSYDHHHKKRLIEMKAMTAERTRGERDRKERRRQEKEASKLREQIERAHQARLASDGAAAPSEANVADPSLSPLPPDDDGAPPPPPPPDAAPPPPPPDVPDQAHPASWASAGMHAHRHDPAGAAHVSAWTVAPAKAEREQDTRSGSVAPQPTPPPPPMQLQFSMGGRAGSAKKPVLANAAAKPAPSGSRSARFSIGAQKAQLQPAVAGFGLDSDEEE